MKRKVTELEQKLIDSGYTLCFKSYIGKHSQFTEYYEYSKFEQFDPLFYVRCVVRLDPKRTKIKFYGIDYPKTIFSKDLVKDLNSLLEKIESIIF